MLQIYRPKIYGQQIGQIRHQFWLAVEVEFEYIPNSIPYLGKDEARPATQTLSESVVIMIMES